ncbi:redox-regulated ATPase YchF [Candidatus Babeliales bacterium]|nr:redox-regulated ATPase YchF [Candidatus Babeliales bacterium]
MAIKAGLVGLPNVGKSTLFNALTKSSIPAENYPFCTVDPHIAITEVPDERLNKLAEIFKSEKKINTVVQFVDIAGLVKGAAKGEGLGNQFLSNIMEVDLILHIVRCFEDSNITHVHNQVNPIEDFETILTELMLKDLESVEKRETKIEHSLKILKNKQASTHQIKDLEKEKELIKALKAAINEGNHVLVQKLVQEYENMEIKTIELLSAKNFLIIANLSEDDFANKNYSNNEHYKSLVNRFGKERVIPVSAKIEFELAQLSEEEYAELIESLEINESGLNNIIKQSYKFLDLITFFTCGPKEAHAWSIKRGLKVDEAAGEIHSDMEKGFIRAEVYNCRDIFKLGSEGEVKNAGRLRLEGKEYIVEDGDLLNILFNV